MASLTTVGKAQATGLLLEKLFGEPPSYDYGDDYVRIYYEPDRLARVQKKIESMAATTEPGEIRVDWIPTITPLMIKKAVPWIVGIFVVGYIVGKI